MFDVAIYCKTMKGRLELADRKVGIGPRLRQALVLVDGHTPYGKLKLMLAQLGEPDRIMARLSELGLVESDYDLPEMPVFPQHRLEDHTTVMQFHATR